MTQIPLTIACNDYDRTRPIMDGRVRVEGCDVTFLPLEAEEVFFRAFRDQAFDVSELSFSSFMLQTTRADCPYVGLPAFVSRMFRHSGIYIRTDRGIRSPADLRGRLVGVPEYQMTAIVWIRGILKDEYGVDPSDIHFRSGGQEEPGRGERTPLKLTNGVDLQPIAANETLVDLFVQGKLDALFTARAPSCYVNGAPNIDRLFPDYREVEKAYYRKTGLFPIMHLIGIRKSLAEKHPWLPVSVYKAFCEAKAIALSEVRDVSALNVTLPWVEAEALDTIRLMGRDYWKYGIAENIGEIEALARYSFEQGLALRKLTPADLFHKSTFEISRIEMLRTGKEHLERLRDGRIIYIGSERVDDVTTHPAFRNAARTIASIYDMKADPAHADAMSFTEDGNRHSLYFLQARTREDLRRRMRCHKMIADMTYGLFGRSPDHVGSYVTAMAMNPQVFDTPARAFSRNVVDYYRHIRDSDNYVAYAVLPPQGARDPDFYLRKSMAVPTLEVVRETDDGIVISGMKMLATGAAFADEIWIGNIQPLAPNQIKQAVTCAVPCNAPGLTLWSRQPIARNAANEFDAPLSWRFDESDSMVMCDNVKVPWHRVFVLDDAALSRDIYIRTAAHCYGNHQSNVRYWAKLQFIVGLASRVAAATGADQIPAVRETLGRLAALEATLGAMIHGQIEACEPWPEDFVTFNRRFMYAALNWCIESYASLIDILRELSGGGVFQMPASVTVLDDPALREKFEQYWQTPQMPALDRVKLFKLVWDLVGSEFAGRHLQYEKFYAGAMFTVRAHNFREAPWDAFHKVVDDLMASYGPPFGSPEAQK